MTRRRRLWRRSWPEHAALKAEVSLTVPFQDADPTGDVWHGNYFRYYDAARSALLRKLRFGYRRMAADRQVWPIVDTRVRYRKSVPFGARIDVSAQLVEWEFRIVIYYEIDDESGALVNEAYTVQAPVSAPRQTLIVGTPPALRERVDALIGG